MSGAIYIYLVVLTTVLSMTSVLKGPLKSTNGKDVEGGKL